MKTLSSPHYSSYLLRLALVCLLASCFFAISPQAWAQLPTGGLEMPGVNADAKWYQSIGGIVVFGGFIFIIVTFIFGLGSSIMALFQAIGEARESDNWGKVIKIMVIIFVIIATALALFVIANNFGFNPLKTYLGIN